jgi:hypothetical protein
MSKFTICLQFSRTKWAKAYLINYIEIFDEIFDEIEYDEIFVQTCLDQNFTRKGKDLLSVF